nr:DUF2268 domain-containing protein [Metabacillus mangrovi]
MKQLKEEKLWEYVSKEMKKLQKKWDGPDPAVFLLPCDLNNAKIQRDHGGKSGLAFFDKLFLFLSPGVPKEELKGLLIHEYHHICRIEKFEKKEKDYTLTDVVIMEGLAENAVREMLGEGKTASWTRLYKDPQLKQFWKKHIVPNGKIKQDHRDFDKLMYGLGMYPNMLGYTAGYYAVEAYMKKTNADTKTLFTLPAEQIIKEMQLEDT